MATNKTLPTTITFEEYLSKIAEPQRQEEAKTLAILMEAATQEKPEIWAGGIVGFGKYHYKYESGRSGEWMKVGFAVRKNNIVAYIMGGFNNFEQLLNGLGNYKTGKSCLYLKKLEDVNIEILKELITQSVAYIEKKYG